MSNQPTDFNDQASVQGLEALTSLIDADLSAIDTDRSRANEAPAQLSEGENTVSEPEYGEQNSDIPLGNASRVDDLLWKDRFEVNQYGKPLPSVSNIELVLTNDERWQGVLSLCQLSHRIIKLKPPPMMRSETGEWSDQDAAAARIWFARQYGFTPKHTDLDDALIVVSRSNGFHPVRHYLQGLVWDGVPRLKTWLSVAFKSTEKAQYLELIGPKIMVGAVARVMQPGCKAEEVLILEGNQGKGKSTVIATLFGEWFSDSPLPIGKVAAQELIQGKWCFEIAELDSFHKAESTALKQFLSQQIDRFRPPYARRATDFKRQTVFWASTNQDQYLKDYTGNRRFWPVFCSDVNKSWVRDNRDQLWAEALHLYKNRHKTGFTWWVSRETPEREAEWQLVTEVQDSRMQGDPWEGMVLKFFDDNNTASYYHVYEILKGIGVDGGHQTQAMVNRLAPILRSLGWKNVRKRVPVFGGKPGETRQIRVWVNEEKHDEVPF